jgi:hypothetical protein
MSANVYKRLSVSDTFVVPYTANKSWDVDSGSFADNKINVLVGVNYSGSMFDPNSEYISNGQYDRLVYDSINLTYYPSFLPRYVDTSLRQNTIFNDGTLTTSSYYKGYIDPSYFTTANFTTYWAYKWKSIYTNNKDKVIKDSTVSAAITKWAQYYGVPLDFAKACCAVESGFNPNSGAENDNYKGLYAIGRSEWKKFFGNSSNWNRDVHNADMNAKCGIHLLQQHLKNANQIINECVL